MRHEMSGKVLANWRRIYLLGAFYGALLTGSSSLRADEHLNSKQSPEYRIPDTPPLYRSNGAPGNQLKFGGGLYAGGNFGFGQSRKSGGVSNPITAYSAGMELGYVAGSGSWLRYGVALEVFLGEVGHSKATLAMSPGGLIKIGRGYSLSSDVFALWHVGVGAVRASFSGVDSEGTKIESTDTILGTALRVGYGLAIPLNQTVSLTAGVKLTFFSFNLSEVRSISDAGGGVTNVDQNIALNVPAAQLGIRVKI